MSGFDKDRLRNKTVSFRVSPEEARQLEARIKVSGLPKGQYFIQSLLHQEINIVVGKYQSDRLSLELRRLREELQRFSGDMYEEHLRNILEDSKALLTELKLVIAPKIQEDRLRKSDFDTVK